MARGGVSGEFVRYLPEKLPLLLTPLTYIHVGNAGSRCRSNRLIPAYVEMCITMSAAWENERNTRRSTWERG